SYTEINLSTNVAYGRVVTADNSGGVSGLSNSAPTYTFAAPPIGSTWPLVWATSTTVQWMDDGNAAGTAYQAFISTDSAFLVAASSNTLNTNATFTGLTSNATYYFHVKAQNGDGFNTGYDLTITTDTP